MANVKNLQIGDNSYVIRDANTYRSLTSTQETQLLSEGTYNNEEVNNNEIFTCYDGTFKQFTIEPTTFSYIPISATLDSVGSTIATSTTVVRSNQGTNGVTISYSEDGGKTWNNAKDSNDNDFTTSINYFCKGPNNQVVAFNADGVYTNVFLSNDNGKTWTAKTGFSVGGLYDNGLINFACYLEELDKYVVFNRTQGTAASDLGPCHVSSDLDEGWTSISLPDWQAGYYWRAPITQYDKDTMLMFNSNDGIVEAITTKDFQNFTVIGTNVSPAGGISSVQKVGDYIFTTYNNNGNKFSYSTDNGETWTWENPVNTYIGGLLCYNNGLYISISNNNFYISEDLLTGWEQYNFMSYTDALPIVYCKNKFIFGSTSGSAIIPAEKYKYLLTQLSPSQPTYNSSTNTLEF